MRLRRVDHGIPQILDIDDTGRFTVDHLPAGEYIIGHAGVFEDRDSTLTHFRLRKNEL